MRRQSLLALAVLALGWMAAGAPAVIAAPQDERICNSTEDLDAAITACTRLIAVGQLSNDERAMAYGLRASHAYKKGQHDRALSDLDQSLRLNPNNAIYYFGRGYPHAAKGNFDEAIADFSAAIRLDPKLSAAYALRGQVYERVGNAERARADFNAALRLPPKGPADSHDIARRGLASLDAASAAPDTPAAAPRPTPASPAAAANPGPRAAQAGNAQGAATALDRERAIIELSETIRRNPNDAKAYYERGVAYDDAGQVFRALADFSDAIRLAPNHFGAHYGRGYAYEREGQLDKAIADYRKALTIDAKDVRARLALGRVEQKRATGDATSGPSVSAPTAARIPPVPPVSPSAASPGLTLSPLLAGPEREISEANEALRRNPRDAAAYSRRGMAYDQLGQYFSAISDLSEAIRLAPDSAPAYYSRAVAHEREGQFAPALADYRKAAALDASDSRARVALNRLEQQIAGRPAASAPSATPPPAVTAMPSVTPAPWVPPRPSVAAPPAAPPAAQSAAPAPTPAPALPAAVAPTLGPAITMANPGPRVALIIGNGNYRYASRLANPPNDAADIAGALRKLGFEVVEGRDLDKRGIEDKLREFGRKLAGAKLALFFYAGHGMQVAGKNYIVPVDAKLEQPGDLRLDTIDLTDVLAQMEAEPRVNLVFLDACRDNPLARSFAGRLGARSASVSQGLAMVQSAIGTMIAYATQPDAVALDGDGRNSPFTTALLRHIGTPGLDISSVMRRVRADVIAATSQRQVPWDHSSLVGDVVLVQ